MGWIILGLLVLGVVAAIVMYNTFVQLNIRADNAFSDIDIQLKRRHDLIPNLVATVEGYAKHEKGTLQSVTEARTKAMGAGNIAQRENAENILTSSLKSLFAVAESYPDLKANTNFLQLQSTLNEIEDHIQSARRYFNAVIRDYNTAREVFPNSIIANAFNFKKRDFFQLNEPQTERAVPKVQF